MAGERQFLGGGEDPDAIVGFRCGGWEHEGRFGQVGPVGESLHRVHSQVFCIDDHRHRVASHQLGGEDVDLAKAAAHRVEYGTRREGRR